MDSMQSNIQTQAIRVLITTDDFEIEGFMHTKPGGYQSRISDILNAKDLHYVPITRASCRLLHNSVQEPRPAETIIVRLDTIKMVIPLDGEISTVAQGAASAAPGIHP